MTAQTIFDGENGNIARSAGTETNARVKVTPGIIGWADVIYCMEKKHIRRIKDKYSDLLVTKKVVCLNIPDDYVYMDDELVGLLRSSVDV